MSFDSHCLCRLFFGSEWSCLCLFVLFFLFFFFQLALDLVRDWLVENARDAMLSGGGNVPELSISGIASYHPFDGLMDLKVVC